VIVDTWEIVPGLSISGAVTPPQGFESLDVDAIVDLQNLDHDWPVPLPPPNRILVRYPIDDAIEVDPKVRDVAELVASLVRNGHRVLIHCTKGLNRSALVAALTLMRMGYSAVDAIERIRERRGQDSEGFGARGNQAFVAWLLQQAPPMMSDSATDTIQPMDQ
jgi:hypothetical protein